MKTVSILEQIAADTILGTVLENAGEWIGGVIDYSDNDGFRGAASIQELFENSFEDFGGELVLNGTNAALSVVNQLILAEIFEAVELDGVGGFVFEQLTTLGINTLVNGFGQTVFGELIEQVGQNINDISVGTSLIVPGVDGAPPTFNVIGVTSFILGAVVNELLPDLETTAGQIGSAIASILATTTILSSLSWAAGPVGALVGFIVGTILDSIFDEDPAAFTMVNFNPETGYFELGTTLTDDGGNAELTQAMAEAFVGTFNGFVDTLGAESHNYVELGNWFFGHIEESIYTRQQNDPENQLNGSFAEVVSYAIVADLATLAVIDGNASAARALEQLDLPTLVENQSYAVLEEMPNIFLQEEPASFDGTFAEYINDYLASLPGQLAELQGQFISGVGDNSSNDLDPHEIHSLNSQIATINQQITLITQIIALVSELGEFETFEEFEALRDQGLELIFRQSSYCSISLNQSSDCCGLSNLS